MQDRQSLEELTEKEKKMEDFYESQLKTVSHQITHAEICMLLSERKNIFLSLKWFLKANRNDELIQSPGKYPELIKKVKAIYIRYRNLCKNAPLSPADIFDFGILLAYHDQAISDAFNQLAITSKVVFDELLMKSEKNIPYALAALQTDTREIVIARIKEQRKQLTILLMFSMTIPQELALCITNYLCDFVDLTVKPEQLFIKLSFALIPSLDCLANPTFFPNQSIYEYVNLLFNVTLDMEQKFLNAAEDLASCANAALETLINFIVEQNASLTQLERAKNLNKKKLWFFSCYESTEPSAQSLSPFFQNCRHLAKIIPKKTLIKPTVEKKKQLQLTDSQTLDTSPPRHLQDNPTSISNTLTIHNEDKTTITLKKNNHSF